MRERERERERGDGGEEMAGSLGREGFNGGGFGCREEGAGGKSFS